LPPPSADFLLGSVFDPEDEGDMFLRNVAFSTDYTALQPRRPLASLQVQTVSQNMDAYSTFLLLTVSMATGVQTAKLGEHDVTLPLNKKISIKIGHVFRLRLWVPGEVW
jgi:hypothetical protein